MASNDRESIKSFTLSKCLQLCTRTTRQGAPLPEPLKWEQYRTLGVNGLNDTKIHGCFALLYMTYVYKRILLKCDVLTSGVIRDGVSATTKDEATFMTDQQIYAGSLEVLAHLGLLDSVE